MPRRIRSILEKTPSHRTQDLRVVINILTKHVINLRSSIRNMMEKKRLTDLSQISEIRHSGLSDTHFISYSPSISQKTALASDYKGICSDHVHILSFSKYEFEKSPVDLFSIQETVSVEIDDREGGFIYQSDLETD